MERKRVFSVFLKVRKSHIIISFLILSFTFGWGYFYGKNTVETKMEKGMDPISVEKVNINTADYYDLIAIDGIGETKAKKIISYIQENGCFNELEDLVILEIISSKDAENIRDEVVVEIP